MKRQIFAIEKSAEASIAARTISDDLMRALAAAIIALARADWPLGCVEAAAYLKCKVDTLHRIPIQQLPRQKAGKEATYLKQDLFQYLITYCRDQPKAENLLATPRRRRPSFDSDGGRGRDSWKGKAS